MIEIHKISDQTVKLKYLLKGYENCEYFGVFDGDELLEFSVYTVENKVLNIKYISNIQNDFSLIHGLLKSIIFVADLNSTDSVTMPLEYERAAKAIGFKYKDNKYILKLEDYRNTCESDKL